MLADGVVVGRIFNSAASPVGAPWMWTLAFGQHKDRTPTHGYEARREAAMALIVVHRDRRRVVAGHGRVVAARNRVVASCVALRYSS